MEGGVLGVLPGIIGTLQATEAIKLLTGIGEPMIGKLLHYDALNSRFKTFNTRKDPECKICGINTHHKRRSNPNEYGFNIACIEGFEMSWIENAPYIDNTKMSLVDTNKSKITK